MKLSKKNQRSLAALFVAVGLLGVFTIAHSVVQIMAGAKAAGEEHERAIGVMSTSSYVLGTYGADKVQPIVVIERARDSRQADRCAALLRCGEFRRSRPLGL